ncbi:hypothetical protein BV22DRAFT_828332 [Leucogyrophana mollusca]|uniref:Uncharacterized protein n=1 Tax=Leucogyrophana mollusca TaxID=85980 RepID=A0ACB8B2Y4_9AGAM|nr:hypothetical protein BV22DRAFT_828332 [Leucogyrophana mollusca]
MSDTDTRLDRLQSQSQESNRRIQPRSPIESLPFELFLKIFRLVYMQHRRKQLCWPPTQTDQTEWIPEDPTSRSIFPYAVASVCSWWRDILSTVPEYWTRIIIIIDKASPISASSCFEWSNNLPLDVVVTLGGPYDISPRSTRSEKAQVASAMNILHPHISRCKTIRFNVARSSSLPSLPENFHGFAPILHELELRCQSDDGECPTFDAVRRWDFFCPKLSNLLLNGANFGDAGALWLMDHAAHLRRLTISHYKASLYPHKRLSLRDLYIILTRAEAVHTLTLRDLEFDTDPVLPGERFSFAVESLSLEDIRGDDDDLPQLFSYVNNYPEQIEITRCAIDSPAYLPNSYVLRLNDTGASENLWRPLATWTGQLLTIQSCASFDDHLLGRMASGGTTGNEFMCPQLLELNIIRCPNFSVTALKHLVQTRREMAARTDSWDNDTDIIAMNFDIVSPLTALRVSGGPPLSAEDEEWFQRNILSFR